MRAHEQVALLRNFCAILAQQHVENALAHILGSHCGQNDQRHATGDSISSYSPIGEHGAAKKESGNHNILSIDASEQIVEAPICELLEACKDNMELSRRRR